MQMVFCIFRLPSKFQLLARITLLLNGKWENTPSVCLYGRRRSAAVVCVSEPFLCFRDRWTRERQVIKYSLVLSSESAECEDKCVCERTMCACVCRCIRACVGRLWMCVLNCVCWHIKVLQSIIVLDVAIETLSLSHMAPDTGLHLIYTAMCWDLRGGTELWAVPVLFQTHHWDAVNRDLLVPQQDQGGHIHATDVLRDLNVPLEKKRPDYSVTRMLNGAI